MRQRQTQGRDRVSVWQVAEKGKERIGRNYQVLRSSLLTIFLYLNVSVRGRSNNNTQIKNHKKINAYTGEGGRLGFSEKVKEENYRSFPPIRYQLSGSASAAAAAGVSCSQKYKLGQTTRENCPLASHLSILQSVVRVCIFKDGRSIMFSKYK